MTAPESALLVLLCCLVALVGCLVVLGLVVKLYSEYAKDMSQRGRSRS